MTEEISNSAQKDDPFERVQSILDEYGDFSDQPAVVREAGFSFPNSAGALHIQERVDPGDLDGPSVLRVWGGDNRDAEWRLSPDRSLDSAAADRLQRDLDLYVEPAKAEAFKRRFGAKAIKAS